MTVYRLPARILYPLLFVLAAAVGALLGVSPVGDLFEGAYYALLRGLAGWIGA